ncbi:MAG: 3-isopropylmalate dehydratase small subunit, partial [Tepidanaerobacteraceae bacterium]
SINIGLPILECEECVDEVSAGDELEIDTDKGVISNLTTGKTYKAKAFPEFISEIINAGGLLGYAKKVGK